MPASQPARPKGTGCLARLGLHAAQGGTRVAQQALHGYHPLIDDVTHTALCCPPSPPSPLHGRLQLGTRDNFHTSSPNKNSHLLPSNGVAGAARNLHSSHARERMKRILIENLNWNLHSLDLKLDKAVCLRIISKQLLAPKGAMEGPLIHKYKKKYWTVGHIYHSAPCLQPCTL